MKRFLNLVLALVMLATGISVGLTMRFAPSTASAQAGCRTFAETGKSICGRFLDYWQTHGGLAQQGLPLSGEFSEVNDLDGKTYTVQYFERAVFEKHPENAAPYDVLLSQLGTFQFKRKYSSGDPSQGGQPPAPPAPTATPVPAPAPPNVQTFTGHGRQASAPFPLKAGMSRWHSVSANGDDNFFAWLLDSQGREIALVANEVGASDSTHVINIRTAGTYMLNVTFDGDWTVTVQQ